MVSRSMKQKNIDGQAMLVSRMTPQPHSKDHASFKYDDSMSFGSMLLHALISTEANGDIETCCRAASILCHILKDNVQCKQRILQIELEAPVPSLGSPKPLLHRLVKCLASAAPTRNKQKDQVSTGLPGDSYSQPMILRLLVTWLADCPDAVSCFLDSPAHLTYILELISSSHANVCVRGLAAIILGECVIYNKSSQNGRDAFAVLDEISQKIGLTSYFLNFDEFKKTIEFLSSSSIQLNKPLTRSNTASMIDMEQSQNDGVHQNHENPVLTALFDPLFVSFLKKLEMDIREGIVEAFSNTKNKVAVVPAELEQRSGEVDGDYIRRLKSFVEKQCLDMQDLLGRNATLAEELVRSGGSGTYDPIQKLSSGRDRIQLETIRRDLQEATLRLEMLKSEKAKIEAEAASYQNLAGKLESDLKSLSDAYNSLEQDNFRLETEVKTLRKGANVPYPDVEAIRADAREEAQKESEAELNDLLVCLGQEQSKVEKLSARLLELGEDVDTLLEGIGDDAGRPEESDEDDDGDEK